MKSPEHRYADILHEERPKHEGDDFSKRHPPMALADRAKIFLPFAALKGYEQVVEERTVLYDHEKGLSEDLMVEINDRLRELKRLVETGRKPLVRIRYFLQAPGRQNGEGREFRTEDRCEKVLEAEQMLQLSERRLAFHEIREIVILEQ